MTVERVLVEHGVPAQCVQGSRELIADEHLVDRGHWVELPVRDVARVTVEGPRAHLSATPGRPRAAAPFLGEHVVEVIQGFAGLSPDEFADVVGRGALGE